MSNPALTKALVKAYLRAAKEDKLDKPEEVAALIRVELSNAGYIIIKRPKG